jgi:hypothetical protein
LPAARASPDDRGRARAQEAQVAGRVGAVGELVDRARRRQAPDLRVGDRVAQRGGEPGGPENLEGKTCRRGPQSWSVDRSVSYPATSDPGPSSAAA